MSIGKQNLIIMNITQADKYFLKALDAFDYDMEELVESLDYALSHDEEHAPTLCLLGRTHMEKMKNFREAQHCFEMALIADKNYVDTYKYYSKLLIWIGQLDHAKILIQKAEKIVGMPKVVIIQRKASMYECAGKVDLAMKETQKGRLLSGCADFYAFFTNEEDRLKRKVYKNSKKKKKSKLRKKTA
jgi:tetratricopeptide (TPR) repeat protein